MTKGTLSKSQFVHFYQIPLTYLDLFASNLVLRGPLQ